MRLKTWPNAWIWVFLILLDLLGVLSRLFRRGHGLAGAGRFLERLMGFGLRRGDLLLEVGEHALHGGLERKQFAHEEGVAHGNVQVACHNAGGEGFEGLEGLDEHGVETEADDQENDGHDDEAIDDRLDGDAGHGVAEFCGQFTGIVFKGVGIDAHADDHVPGFEEFDVGQFWVFAGGIAGFWPGIGHERIALGKAFVGHFLEEKHALAVTMGGHVAPGEFGAHGMP